MPVQPWGTRLRSAEAYPELHSNERPDWIIPACMALFCFSAPENFSRKVQHISNGKQIMSLMIEAWMDHLPIKNSVPLFRNKTLHKITVAEHNQSLYLSFVCFCIFNVFISSQTQINHLLKKEMCSSGCPRGIQISRRATVSFRSLNLFQWST